MNRIKTNKILVPIDFSDISENAIVHAGVLAALNNGELLFLHVQKKRELIDIILPALNQDSIKPLTDSLSLRLQKLAAREEKNTGVKITSDVVAGNITSEIVKVAEKNNVDLIVMGTRGKDSVNDLFMGSNSYRALTKSQVPILTVQETRGNSSYKNILIPIDTSAHSRQKVDSAIYLAKKCGANLHVVCLIGKGEEDQTYKMEVILKQIHKFAKENNVHCEGVIENSVNRAETTLSYAQKVHADLIVIMTDQHAEFSSIVLGTYAHQLINESKIPVLCIPPEVHPENIPSDSLGGMW